MEHLRSPDFSQEKCEKSSRLILVTRPTERYHNEPETQCQQRADIWSRIFY